MKLTKSLLLASVAGFAAVASAQAADLPSKKAAPVEYVKVCPTYGPGFFYLPGTQTCVKVTPRVTFDYLLNNPFQRSAGATQPRTRAYIQADAREATEYGLVRVYASVYGEFIGSSATQGNLDKTSGKNSIQSDAAFVQFGGLTAGRYDPQIEEAWGYNYSQAGAVKVRNPVTDGPTNGIMYAASLGNGVTALVSLEDSTVSRMGAASLAWANATATTNGTAKGAAGTATADLLNPNSGMSVPDVIAKLKVDQAWGGAFLSAGTHEIRGQFGSATGDAGYGYAVKGGVKFNLPMLAAGDDIGFNVGYSNGFNAATFAGYNAVNPVISVGGYNFTAPDAIDDNEAKKTKAWSAAAGMKHYWSPTVYSTLFGHYANIDQYGASNTVKIYSVGSMLAWTPIKGFVISGEAYYSKVSMNAAIDGTQANATTAQSLRNGVSAYRNSSQNDMWTGRIRVSRSF